MNEPRFPLLEMMIARNGITKKSIASRKLSGKTEFTLKEIRYICALFPDVSVESLFVFPDCSKEYQKEVTLTLDDSQIMQSLDRIEKKADKISEKVNRLKSALSECEKSVG